MFPGGACVVHKLIHGSGPSGSDKRCYYTLGKTEISISLQGTTKMRLVICGNEEPQDTVKQTGILTAPEEVYI